MENPIWNVRLKELLHLVGIELGYGLVTLDAELEKLVVYEPGGRLMRHKCAEDVAGEVAKLVVQLPSMFTGGDLVVYSDEDSSKHCRMDMGKKADTAAYSPCCAVYVAGAEHAVEEVKNGYRVVLVYSLRVPEDEYSPGVTRAGQLVVREMCDSMAEFGEKESFALLLSTNYGYAGLEKKGIELLKDEDRRQFDALQKANALLPPEKQLKFYLVELNQSTELIRDVCTGGGAYYRNRGFEPVSRSGNGVVGTPWEVTGNSESSVWFSINGEKLRDWNFEHGGDPLQWSAHLNFLNPGTLSPREMWSDHMSRDGLVDEQTIEYTAHAIVGWPLARDLENTSTLIGKGAAIKGILAENPVKFLKLRTLMEIAVGNENDKEHRCSWDNSVSPYMNFCQDMCSAIAAAGDVSLVGKFFTKFFGRLKNKQQLAPTILIMMNQFGWDAIAAHLTGAMNQQNQHDALVFAVKLADDCRAEAKFESPATMLAIEKARGVPGEVLSSFDHLGLLWKCASTCPSPAAFTAIETLLKNLDGGLLAPVLTCISSCVDQASPTNQRSALTALVSSRCQWLAGEISRQHKVFSWEMPDAHFPANAEVENFLRGEHSTFALRGFGGITAARKFVSDNNRTPNGPNRTASYTMSAQGSGKNAAVVVTKTREYFESLKKKLDAMSDELARLSKDYPLSTSSMNSTIGIKRPRDE
ncbi:hypothetical protein PF008_g17255 [Phytophthora fragariae]|uniref:Fe2OG dioxygenase domain-containing protein n=1 Tax=Phytophthora fragariae TaxID=53985 RepID=A0A6G0R9M6_9STRA|nr:hypothetical protein PF008_g17255 [Phytophthora fragariae]